MFVISPFLLARMKDSLNNAISLDQKTTSIWVSIKTKNEKKGFPLAEIRFFKDIDLPLIAIMASEKIWMKEYRFP